MNIVNTIDRQFDQTLNREGQIVTDFYSGNAYKVFFRKESNATDTQTKLRMYYEQGTNIVSGTMLLYQNDPYLIVNRERTETGKYFMSLAVKCSESIPIKYNDKWYNIPLAIESDQYGISENNVITLMNGSVTVYTAKNNVSQSIAINKQCNCFGGTYSIQNYFYRDNLAYLYLTRTVNADTNVYEVIYTGNTLIDRTNTSTYQLSYETTINGVKTTGSTLAYASSDTTVATVDSKGMLTMLQNGNVTITATWSDKNVSCSTNLTITGTITPADAWTMNITGSTTMKVGYSKSYVVNTFNNGVSTHLDGVQFEIINNASNIVFTTKTFNTATNTITLCVSDNAFIEKTFTIRAYHTAQSISATFNVTVKGLF